MDSIIFKLLILLFIISISYTLRYDNDPIIVVTQKVIEIDGLLPITVFWYYANFTNENWLLVHHVKTEKRYADYLKIESHTGFYELPSTALLRDGTPDQYCVAIRSEKATTDNNPSCKSKLQWMYNQRDIFKDFSLKDLIIPGTHQSAGYVQLNGESLGSQNSQRIFYQTKSIKTQLMDGIRYLDLRPSSMHIKGKKKYIATYEMINPISMDEIGKQINEFMDLSKDIVIVSFKEFSEGFDSIQDHLEFIEYLQSLFSYHAHTREDWTYTLDRFWYTNKRLILSYDHDAYKESLYMWPRIAQYWSAGQTINRLHVYFDALHRSINDSVPYASMIKFTFSPTTQDKFSRNINVRYSAERLGRRIPQWLTEECNSTANIIAVDFYQTSGIVDIAIQLNGKRADDRYLSEKV